MAPRKEFPISEPTAVPIDEGVNVVFKFRPPLDTKYLWAVTQQGYMHEYEGVKGGGITQISYPKIDLI